MVNDPKIPSTADVGLQVTPASISLNVAKYISLIRAKIRDYPELNRLIDGHESSDRDIALALMETLTDYNSSPPLIAPVALADFPDPSLLIRGTLAFLLEGVALNQLRNQIDYVDGSSRVSISDKSPQIQVWINIFRNQYETKKDRLKRSLNLMQALNGTGLNSEYGFLNEFDYYLRDSTTVGELPNE